MSSVQNWPSQDAMPQAAGNVKPIPIATVSASSSTNGNEASNILNDTVDSKWTSKGMDEFIILELPNVSKVNRLDIQWDPELSRTGRFGVWTTTDKENPASYQQAVASSIDRAAYSSAYLQNLECSAIKIVCGGNAENDLNGIVHVKIFEEEEKPKKSHA